MSFKFQDSQKNNNSKIYNNSTDFAFNKILHKYFYFLN